MQILLKRQKKAQEEEKKRKLEEEKNKVQVEKQEVIPFLWEMDTCKWLINHFQKIINIPLEQTKEETNNIQGNAKKENNDSKLKPIDLSKREDEQPIQLADEQRDKKVKGSKKKENIPADKSYIDFIIDINLINKIQEIKLSPPGKTTEIPAFLVDLKRKLEEYEKRSEEEKARMRVKIKVNQETAAKGNLEEEYEGEENFI